MEKKEIDEQLTLALNFIKNGNIADCFKIFDAISKRPKRNSKSTAIWIFRGVLSMKHMNI
jgi:hypothetical protein